VNTTRMRLAAVIAAGALVAASIIAAGSVHHARQFHAEAPMVVSRASREKLLGTSGAHQGPNIYAQPMAQGKTKPLRVHVADSNLQVILDGTIIGYILMITHYVAHHPKEVFQLIKNGIFKVIGKNKFVESAPNDGRCVADWHWDQYAEDGSCSDKTGIFWEFNPNNGRFYNTYTGGNLFAWGDTSGRHTSTYWYNRWPSSLWKTWWYSYICANSTCTKTYGIVAYLKNHNSEGLSNGDSS
jgi:hypothetical protein